jgi:hypothetical protein
MKSRLFLLLMGAVLLVTAGAANGAETWTTTQPSSRAQMQQNANESAQAATDMSYTEKGQNATATNTSYGGVAGGQSDRGAPHGRSCATGPECNIYFGN